MIRSSFLWLIFLLSSTIFISCGEPDEIPILAGDTKEASIHGENLFRKAQNADSKGKKSAAIKLYKKVADRYPFTSSASKARFREAELLEQKGNIQEAFQAYDKFLSRHQASVLYTEALNRQASIAFQAANGEIKTSFLGLKSNLAEEKIIEMLGAIRKSAPRSKLSEKAQFQIGQIYHKSRKTKDCISAYRKLVEEQPESSLAPEALFQIGVVLLEEADRGNRNQATLELSREAFNDYLMQYPSHKKREEARQFLKAIGGKQIGTTLSIAEFYDRTKQAESAKIYYKEVLKRAAFGPEHDQAKSRLKSLESR